jgi:hypothetical protein
VCFYRNALNHFKPLPGVFPKSSYTVSGHSYGGGKSEGVTGHRLLQYSRKQRCHCHGRVGCERNTWVFVFILYGSPEVLFSR